MPYFKLAGLILILLFTGGCGGNGNFSKQEPTLNVRLLGEGVLSGIDRPEPQAIWIDGTDRFENMVARLTRNQAGESQDLSDRVDFSREGVLILAMGRKPTGGYRLELNEKVAVISGDAAILQTTWVEPAKGAILPQIITSPFLMVILPQGPYSRIQVLDQEGRLRLKLRVREGIP